MVTLTVLKNEEKLAKKDWEKEVPDSEKILAENLVVIEHSPISIIVFKSRAREVAWLCGQNFRSSTISEQMEF